MNYDPNDPEGPAKAEAEAKRNARGLEWRGDPTDLSAGNHGRITSLAGALAPLIAQLREEGKDITPELADHPFQIGITFEVCEHGIPSLLAIAWATLPTQEDTDAALAEEAKRDGSGLGAPLHLFPPEARDGDV